MRLLLALAVGLTLAGSTHAQDVAWSQTVTLRFDEDGGDVRLREETEVEVRYVSERSTRGRTFHVQDAHYAPVEGLRAWWNGSRLGRADVQRRTPQSADVFLMPGAVHEITAPDAPAPGDALSYRFERTFADAAYAPLVTVPDVDRVERFEVVVEHPPSLAVAFEVFDPRGRLAPVTERSGPGRTSVRFEGVGASSPLPLFAHAGVAAQVMVRVSRGGRPVLPTSPAAFAAWYGGLTAAARPDALSADLAALAESLRRDTDAATVAAIHDHIRQSVRYVADERAAGAIVPRAPDLVVSRGYGDCKDRAFLAVGLAQHLGLDVDAVLVSTEPVADFDAAHVALYNHMIAAWDAPDGATVFFDPTHRDVPFGALPESNVSAQALRLTGGGAERVVIPAPAGGPTLDVTVRASLDAPGQAVAEVTVRGELFGAVRRAAESGRAIDVENVLSAVTAGALFKIRLDEFVPLSMAADSAHFSAQADLSEFVIASPTRRYVPKTPFRAVPSAVAERADDALPIWLDGRPDVRLVLEVEAAGLAAAADSVRLGSPAASAFAADLAPSDGGARIEYRFRQSARRFDGADRDAYLALALAYLDARRDMFVFRPTEDS